MAIAEAWFCAQVTHFCVVFEVCVWISGPVGRSKHGPIIRFLAGSVTY